jgi:hypothetical protein
LILQAAIAANRLYSRSKLAKAQRAPFWVYCSLLWVHVAAAARWRVAMARMLLPLFLLPAAVGYSSTAAPPPLLLSVFVSPTGSDVVGDGSAAKPHASLSRAQTAVRELLRQHGAGAGNITVHVAGGGRYELSEPLVFDERDHHQWHGGDRRVTWVGPPKDSENKAKGAVRDVTIWLAACLGWCI